MSKLPFLAALVTGSAGRIGRSIAMRLAEQGVAVAVHYASSKTDAEDLVNQIRSEGGDAVSVHADLLNDDDMSALVGEAASALGSRLDILVNNASIFEYDNLETATFDSWTRHMATNLKAPLFLTQAFAQQAPDLAFDDNDEPVATGCVINLIDQRVLKPTPEFMTYSLAKSGLWAFTRTAAQALAPRIRVNGIGPGPTVQGHRQSEAHFQAQRQNTILERGSSSEEIAHAVEFLLKSPGITGQLLCLDGGQHLAWKTPDVLGVE
ncbi:MAG: SDR family oxidoreductase [Pseudomonadota bacterium]